MTLVRLLLAATATCALAAPAAAQMGAMPGMNMPGMKMPPAKKKPAAKKPRPKRSANRDGRATASHVAAPVRTHRPAHSEAGGHPAAGMEAMDHSAMPGMSMPADHPSAPGGTHDMSAMPGMQMPADEHGGHDMQAMPGIPGMGAAADAGVQPTGTSLPAGNAPPPPVPTDHAADSVFGPAAMMESRHHLRSHGGQTFSQVMLNLAEAQFRNGGDGYRWDAEAWFGSDINRLVVKSEGEGSFRGGVEAAEVQALYSRAVGPYFNLQAGVRHDFQPSPSRTYATVGFEGLAPLFFEAEGALFLSEKGDLLGRLEGYYDQRITQRLVLQPRAELNFSAQHVPENRIGSGLTNAELGLRLRYEIRREFAPYVGISWDRRVGDTAKYWRAAGEQASSTSIVAGVRLWF